MVLAFNPDVPQGAQTIAATQSPLLQNMQSLDAAFNDSTAGPFTKYEMQATSTPAAPVGSISVLHTALDSLSNPGLSFRNSLKDYLLTSLININVSGSQFCYDTPWGWRIHVGQGTYSNGSTVTVDPAIGSNARAFGTPFGGSTQGFGISISGNIITFSVASGTINLQWMVISNWT